MAEQGVQEDIEDEQARHRQERRDLQTSIQQLKRSCNKTDKTRKKKVDSEIRALEEAFAKRWQHFTEEPTIPPSTVDNNLPQTKDDEDNKQHVSRKARRMANKEKRHAEAFPDEEPIEYDSLPASIRRRDESSSIDAQLAERGLEMRSVASDGNCLFASLIDQSSSMTVRQLREAVAQYLRTHRTEFEPFIEMDFDSYCNKIAKENEWGGQVELQACAAILQAPIEIIQGNGDVPIRIECSSSNRPIVLTYHRYLFANGEHYNSTVPITTDE